MVAVLWAIVLLTDFQWVKMYGLVENMFHVDPEYLGLIPSQI